MKSTSDEVVKMSYLWNKLLEDTISAKEHWKMGDWSVKWAKVFVSMKWATMMLLMLELAFYRKINVKSGFWSWFIVGYGSSKVRMELGFARFTRRKLCGWKKGEVKGCYVILTFIVCLFVNLGWHSNFKEWNKK